MLASIPPIESKGHSLLPEQTLKNTCIWRLPFLCRYIGAADCRLGEKIFEGTDCMGTFTLFTDVALVAVRPDAATAVALRIGIQQQLFFSRACF